MTRTGTPRLSLAEAYHAAQSFMVHIGAIPTRVDEPVDGIVELEGDEFIARIKFDHDPIGQGAILALIKVADEHEGVHAMFSLTGFSEAAHELAEAHAVALFVIDVSGDMTAVSAAAKAMMPDEPFVAPFVDPGVVDFPVADDPEAPIEGDVPILDHEWLDCPSCGTTHHPSANFCASCGNTITKRNTPSKRSTSKPKPDQKGAARSMGDRALSSRQPMAPLDPVPGRPTLQCRTCGSHDIELIGQL